jgi:hypothetical protein
MKPCKAFVLAACAAARKLHANDYMAFTHGEMQGKRCGADR